MFDGPICRVFCCQNRAWDLLQWSDRMWDYSWIITSKVSYPIYDSIWYAYIYIHQIMMIISIIIEGYIYIYYIYTTYIYIWNIQYDSHFLVYGYWHLTHDHLGSIRLQLGGLRHHPGSDGHLWVHQSLDGHVALVKSRGNSHGDTPGIPSSHSSWKWPSRNSGFTHWNWWFSIVMLVYQRVSKIRENDDYIWLLWWLAQWI